MKESKAITGKNELKGKEIVLGICGGISAYKVPSLIRILKSQGAGVTCILTENGSKFVTPLTLRTLSTNKVYNDMFDAESWDVEHVVLAKKADLIVVVPATADAIARFAAGRAEDLLSCVVLASRSKILLCPAMNENMWLHKATQENVSRLRGFGYLFMDPGKGELACGDTGIGRLPEIQEIVTQIKKLIA